METVLGVRGLAKIQEAVLRCWASHFALPAVEYRRQHGQPIHSAMGVVIQEMVPAEAAGWCRNDLICAWSAIPSQCSMAADYY